VTRPTPPNEVSAEPGRARSRIAAPRVEVDEAFAERLRSVCTSVRTDEEARIEASRDWWPISIGWANRGEVPSLPALVASPSTAEEVSSVLRVSNEARVPVTVVAGRSGVCGASVPVFGGVAMDLCAMAGVTDVDTTSLLARALPGTFGPDLEEQLQSHDLTLGHWPQSMDISTVGGWLACRGAGQYSTRYGKAEDMVTGLEVALADGRQIRTGGTAPRSATGPDLTQLFVGSEGTLGVITAAWLRLHPKPSDVAKRTFGFSSFETGLDACRKVMRSGATPAVLRLYDEVESERNFSIGDRCVLIVLDEAHPSILGPTIEIVESACASCGSTSMDEGLVDRWLEHRNDVSALAPLYRAGVVVDTVEIAGRWSVLSELYRACVAALVQVEGTLVASAHQSHAYADGACLYFTFAGRMPDPSETAVSEPVGEGSGANDLHDQWAQSYYKRAWDAVTEEVLGHGAAISHHHGVGINRSRFMRAALGEALDVLGALKSALDPRGILNPGKLGVPSAFGEVRWP
jgi:alkyldihydroxyacetonephosphate synthase